MDTDKNDHAKVRNKSTEHSLVEHLKNEPKMFTLICKFVDSKIWPSYLIRMT